MRRRNQKPHSLEIGSISTILSTTASTRKTVFEGPTVCEKKIAGKLKLKLSLINYTFFIVPEGNERVEILTEDNL